MEIFVLILVAFGASWLTFYSGFGLGTLLTPVFIFLFRDPLLAIACTAIVHFSNNLFKFLLMKKSVDWKIAGPFALAAIPAAFLGSYLIQYTNTVSIHEYAMNGELYQIELLNVIFGVVLIGFALIELIPKWSLAFSKQSLLLGGAVSGFFGGLSGHQGALRSAFLIKYKLDKNVFIATGIIVALSVDIVRTPMYFRNIDISDISGGWIYIFIALAAALIGAITGKFFLKKMKLSFLNISVSIAMIVFGIVLILGIL
ncbi:MAG: sulfite exporter TauE/SafE family protein [Crocinitomicaceae bacterium]